jgi:hypothetical protein
VLSQLIEAGPDRLSRIDGSRRTELVARANEAAELVRRLRADTAFESLSDLGNG